MIRRFQTHFYVRTARKDPAEAELSIRSRVTIGRAAAFYLQTGLSIQSRFWDAKRERPKTYVGNNPALAEYLRRTDDKLSRLEYEFKLFIATHEDVTKEMLQAIIDGVVDDETLRSKGLPTRLSDYCDHVIKQMIDGTRLAKCKSGGVNQYSAATIKGWKSFQKLLADYDEGRLFWDSATAKDMERFGPWLASRGLLPRTQNLHILRLKSLARMALKDGILKNPNICDELVNRSTSGEGSVRTNIYLTPAELEALYDMPLKPGSTKEKVRDVFCLGCFICQRVSDYNFIKKEKYTATGTGTPIIRLVQHKTGRKVSIPLSLSPHILELAEKYDYDMPSVDLSTLNEYIKKICHRLAKTVPSLNEKVPTPPVKGQNLSDLEVNEKGLVLMPRWKLVESHTARRSGLTNLYMSGKLTDAQIMSISGHTTHKNLERYLLQGPDFMADKIDERLKDTTL